MRDESIFAAALGKAPGAERQAFLDEACGGDEALRRRVELLLESDARSVGILERGPGILAAQHGPATEEPGDCVGPYRLVELIGEGGMGSVYRAEQSEPVRRRVALKVIKPGMDSRQVLARFEAERQALALMDHPGIARVLDAGTTAGGRPYFVMELVQGVPITTYSDQNLLTPQDRLTLFIAVCRAIQHAHQKGIIHRDVKPSNVLVTQVDGQPVPKVIDFGIAKAVDQRLTERTVFTEIGAIIGTPEYMSPEQAGLSGRDVDTRSDVFSLGVLLYELLTGTTPLEREHLRRAAFDEILRRIREEEPPAPSTRLGTTEELPSIAACRRTEPDRLTKLVRGDLDWIVMKALEKDPTRRYATADALAQDVQRHLDGDPVEAGPPSATYRLKKFARRNRAALATATAFILLLVAATAISSWQAVRATRAEGQAKTNLAEAQKQEAGAKKSAAQAKAIADFFRDKVISAARPPGQDGGLGRDVKLRDALNRAEASIAGRFPDEPEVEATIRDALGQSYIYLGEPEAALRQYERALELLRISRGPEAPPTIVAISGVAEAHYNAGRLDKAITGFEEALRLMDQVNGPDHLHTLIVRNNLAAMYEKANRVDEAIALHEQVFATMKAKSGLDNEQALVSLSNLANAYRTAGRIADAIQRHEEVVRRMEATLVPGHPSLPNAMVNLAMDYSEAERYDDALHLLRNALPRQEASLGADHPRTLKTKSNLALVYRDSGRPGEAIPILQDLVKFGKTREGPENPKTLASTNNLIGAYIEAKRWPEAETSARECLEIRARMHSDDGSRFHTMLQLGTALAGQRKFVEAEPLLLEGYEGLSKRTTGAPGLTPKDLARAAARIADLYDSVAQPTKATEWRQRQEAIKSKGPGKVHRPTTTRPETGPSSLVASG
jgi:serine/threonine protein kinase/tetratricopeptide (TPR) repeat protein